MAPQSRLIYVNLPVKDPSASTAFAAAALAAGASPANEPLDHGFMYGRSFNEPDGHLWEVMWMSPEAIERGPADVAQTAA
jgi:uncharacterized protein